MQNITLITNNSESINAIAALISAIATVVLVVVTIHYAIVTSKILKQSRTEKTIAFIEKRLEKLYYPLLDYLKSEEMAMYCSYYDWSLGNIPEDEPSISDLSNPNTKRYDINAIIPYQYLASENLIVPLKDFLFEVRDNNPYETFASSPKFKPNVNNLQQIIEKEIDILRDKLNNLAS
ncbi:MAG: hypothetical protein RBT65_03395 [Methanolobus sp.]|nr:hypothetical protein [Methanolobus sp.]